ncbi:probable leucine-rich repeat receptor-like protein kinase At1g68400 [Impatiens glandulifera]|uniref:probable leucine-rich repeat receptor-like protein kinase At1g68400 n=1 Tax=Impatiens glandulifera TaxID=253017 RepID=UPI001FB18A23|nr:probable leucine-rich repeat receptor-like protein kinase At1g68400 [Impatiens glandulifera]
MKMKQFSLSILVLILSLLPFSISFTNSDSIALLAFKSSLENPSPDSLSSWSDGGDKGGSNSPCNWFGVTCNPSTHRVIKLVLNNLNLTASILPLIKLTHLRHLSLHHNRISGGAAAQTLDISSLQNLKHIYLSHNRFQGKFPTGIIKLRRLHRLDLSYNHFSGHIPLNVLTQIPSLLTLRLEFNSFTGDLLLPTNLSAVTDFNVSGNNLAGRIPIWLSNFPISSFSGNIKLCGNPLPSICSIPPPPNKNRRRLSLTTVLTIIAITAIGLIAIAIAIAYCCYVRIYKLNKEIRKTEKKTNRGNRGILERENGGMVYFEGCKGFGKVDDLLKASAEMLGKGIVGTTYKVTMDGGDMMVVKRIKEMKLRKDFDVGLKVIGCVRHHNIVCLRAYYYSKDELLLVYDFLPNGSLYSLLHGNRGPGRTPLDWTTRLKLALGSANGLSFLHSQNNSKLFHGHFTSSNIIVDQKGNPSISDNGLYQIFHTFPSSSPSTTTHYAPELANSNSISDAQFNNPKFMQRCDVYSFGVILLEILTGRTATGEGETALAKWVKRAIGIGDGKWKRWDVFDFELVRFREMEEEMMALLGVAMLCLDEVPKNRPKMEVVRRKIEDIITLGGGGGGGAGGGCGVSSLDDHQSDSSPALSETTPNFTSS